MAAASNSLKKVKAYVGEYVAALQKDGLPIERVFLFGSCAKGHPRKWSDIDVCIISTRFGKNVDALEYLWTKRRREDVMRGIEPVGFHPREFVDDKPLVWEIKSSGIEIWPSKQSKPARRSGARKARGL